MRTVGEILKSKRLEKKISLEEIQQATKIKASYLEAVEKNEFTKIPGGAPTTKGFIRNYAQFLGLSPMEILAVFRRDFRESKSGEIIPHGYYEPLNQPGFAWHPRLTFFLGLAVLFVSLTGYLFYQVFTTLGEPRLVVTLPREGVTVKEPEIAIVGQSDPDATVLVGGDLVSINQEGDFKTRISLFPGENKIKIEAVSRRGKKSEILRKVFYQP